MASDAALALIAEIIDEARELIRKFKGGVIEAAAARVEEFLMANNLPIDPYYEEREFYSFNVYPIFNFLDVIGTYNKVIKETILTSEERTLLARGQLSIKEAYCNPFIYNFIHDVYYRKFLLISFKNIFYPHNNNKFIFETYQHDARLLIDKKVTCIHPKYILEEAFHKMYAVDAQDFDIPAEINMLEEDWASIDDDYNKMKITNYMNITKADFNPLQNQILKLADEHLMHCFYDKSIPVVITDKFGIAFLTQLFKDNFSKHGRFEMIENSSKSFFDTRAYNYMFKLQGKNIIKVYTLLEYELIPCLPWDEKKAHIDVAIRLAFNEYITYRIIGNKEIADIKLRLHKNMRFRRNQLGDKIMNLEMYSFRGKYYPYATYLKDMKIASLIARNARNN